MPQATIQAQVGPQVLTDGSVANARLEKTGSVVMQELHGRYYESAYRKQMFSASAAGVTTSAGTTTTFTGLAVSNPIGSSVNLAVNKVGAGFSVALAAGAVVGVMAGYSTVNTTNTTTTVARSNIFTGGAGGVATAITSGTLTGTPTVVAVLGSAGSGALTTYAFAPQQFDFEGSLIIPPGGYVASYTSTASGAAGATFSIQWEEIPI